MTVSNTPNSKVSQVSIDSNNAGQRLDNFLLGQLKGVPRSHVYRLLRTGQVRVNSGRAKPLYKLKEGDLVRVPPVRMDAIKSPGDHSALARRLEAAIIYEDAELLAINKPAGIAVHGGSGIAAGVIEALKAQRSGFLELVHRLDRETSGCLLLAKDRPSLLRLHQQLQENQIGKQYSALLVGDWQGKKVLQVNQALRRDSGVARRQVRADEQGKAASSRFSLKQAYVGYSLMNVSIDTGRTHQIRVHAAELGHPVAGDDRYGDKTANKVLRGLGLRRQFLHAEQLSITLNNGQGLQLSAPLPTELQQLLDQLVQIE